MCQNTGYIKLFIYPHVALPYSIKHAASSRRVPQFPCVSRGRYVDGSQTIVI